MALHLLSGRRSYACHSHNVSFASHCGRLAGAAVCMNGIFVDGRKTSAPSGPVLSHRRAVIAAPRHWSRNLPPPILGGGNPAHRIKRQQARAAFQIRFARNQTGRSASVCFPPIAAIGVTSHAATARPPPRQRFPLGGAHGRAWRRALPRH